jgi:hypothetical protein
MYIASCGLCRDQGQLARIFYSPRETKVILNVSHAMLYRLIAAKRLDARKLGNKTLISAESIQRLAAELPAAKVGEAAEEEDEDDSDGEDDSDEEFTALPPTYKGPAHALGHARAEDFVAEDQRDSPTANATAAPAWRKPGARRPPRTELGTAIDFCAPQGGCRALGDVARDANRSPPPGSRPMNRVVTDLRDHQFARDVPRFICMARHFSLDYLRTGRRNG